MLTKREIYDRVRQLLDKPYFTNSNNSIEYEVSQEDLISQVFLKILDNPHNVEGDIVEYYCSRVYPYKFERKLSTFNLSQIKREREAIRSYSNSDLRDRITELAKERLNNLLTKGKQ
jgi:hypothetical protein